MEMDYSKQCDVVVSDSLCGAVKELVSNIKRRPFFYNFVDLTVGGTDEPSINGHTIFNEWYISNRLDSLATNTPDIEIGFYVTGRELEQFMALPNHKLYRYSEPFGKEGWCTVSCGEDVEKAAYLFSEFVQMVWKADKSLTYTCPAITYLDSVERFEIDLKYTDFSEREALTLISDYNKLAGRFDYPVLTVSGGMLKGTFLGLEPSGWYFARPRVKHRRMKRRFERFVELFDGENQ